MLTRRWYPLRPVEPQQRLWRCKHRFVVVPAGRRSGKTELAKRRLVARALRGTGFDRPSFFAAAPTRDQAKRIYWADLKAMVPPHLVVSTAETDLIIRLVTGSEIHVVGLDKPERIEGSPWDGGILDEYANMKPDAWSEHVRPALSDRLGWCWFVGVPEGRNHYYDLFTSARADMTTGATSMWGAYHWTSAEVLPVEEVESARRDLDELSFAQEYEGSFVNFTGQAYYPFDARIHAAHALPYDPSQPLCLCFDFNVSPGVAVVAQEAELPGGAGRGTAVIGEVWIPKSSNTPAVVARLVQGWGQHAGFVRVYGDASGGARGTAQTEGSDWDLVERGLRACFGHRLSMRVPRANPSERSRVNALNSRLKNGAGEVRLMVDPVKAPHVVRDLEGVRLLAGGSGEIDKKHDQQLTHLSDSVGYYVVSEFPVTERRAFSREMDWA